MNRTVTVLRRIALCSSGALLWSIALLVIWIATRQTQLGYEIQRLKQTQEVLRERNLRLRCETASLYDLNRAKQQVDRLGFQVIDPSSIEILGGVEP